MIIGEPVISTHLARLPQIFVRWRCFTECHSKILRARNSRVFTDNLEKRLRRHSFSFENDKFDFFFHIHRHSQRRCPSAATCDCVRKLHTNNEQWRAQMCADKSTCFEINLEVLQLLGLRQPPTDKRRPDDLTTPEHPPKINKNGPPSRPLLPLLQEYVPLSIRDKEKRRARSRLFDRGSSTEREGGESGRLMVFANRQAVPQVAVQPWCPRP
jgi:hypothetical protein